MSSVDLTYQIGLTLLDGVGDVLAKNLVAPIAVSIMITFKILQGNAIEFAL
jgi:hypothetical protein